MIQDQGVKSPIDLKCCAAGWWSGTLVLHTDNLASCPLIDPEVYRVGQMGYHSQRPSPKVARGEATFELALCSLCAWRLMPRL